MADTSTKELTVNKLRAEHILLGPEDGEHITIDPSALWLWKEKGRVGAALRLDRGSPQFSFYDANGQERVSLLLDGDGSPMLFLQDGNGNPRLMCYLTHAGLPFLALQDGARTDRLELNTDPDDFDPIVALNDQTGQTILEIRPDSHGKPSLMIPNGRGGRMPWLTSER